MRTHHHFGSTRMSLLQLASLLIGLIAFAQPAFAIRAGDRIPDFNLKDTDGDDHRLLDQRGYVMLLYFYGHNAEICLTTAPLIESRFNREYRDEGLRIYGVDAWNGLREEAIDFQQRTGVQFPLLLLGQTFTQNCDLSYHSFAVVDAGGIVRYVSAGPKDSAYDEAALHEVIGTYLEKANATKVATWGLIKGIYGGR